LGFTVRVVTADRLRLVLPEARATHLGCVDISRYVIDAPTLLHLVAEGVQVSPQHQIVAPKVIRSQALSLLFESVRRDDLSEKVALQHHERLTELKMILLGDRVSRRTAWRIAPEQDRETTYDAAYLAVTKLQADALVTIDPTFAIKAETAVPLASLADLAID
jgi:predicted nucleic acid-binding protein